MISQSFRRDLWWKAFSWAARFDYPAIAARLLNYAIKEVRDNVSPNLQSINILVLDKPGLSEDARATFDDDSRFRLFVLDTVGVKAFKAIVSAFLPPEIDDYNYINDAPTVVAGRAAYRGFIARTWAVLATKRRIDAVLTGNYGYYAEREVQAALEARDIPFIALHKECLESEGRRAFFTDIYRNRRGRFEGRRILVYNAVERDLQIAAEVAPAESITITGMPRLDRLHAWRRNAAAPGSTTQVRRPLALFFSFNKKTGLPLMTRKDMAGVAGNVETLGDDRDTLNWHELTRLFLDAAITLARRAPDIDVVIKSKANPRDHGALHDYITMHGDIIANLSIISGGDPIALIADADVVTGFITTALFEALAAGKPVILPRFAEATDPAMADYLIDMEDVVDYADTPEGLIEKMADYARARTIPSSELTPKTKALLTRWTGNADGRAGARVADAVWFEVTE